VRHAANANSHAAENFRLRCVHCPDRRSFLKKIAILALAAPVVGLGSSRANPSVRQPTVATRPVDRAAEFDPTMQLRRQSL